MYVCMWIGSCDVVLLQVCAVCRHTASPMLWAAVGFRPLGRITEIHYSEKTTITITAATTATAVTVQHREQSVEEETKPVRMSHIHSLSLYTLDYVLMDSARERRIVKEEEK